MLFLICLWVCFPEEPHIWIKELSKADGPPPCRRVSSNLLRAWIEQKGGRGLNSLSACLFEWASDLLLPWCSWFSDLQAQTGSCTISSWALETSPTSSPGSPGFKWQVMGILSLHNHMNQYLILFVCVCILEPPWWLSGKESAYNAEDAGASGLIPGSGRPPRGGHSNPLQRSCLENPVDRGAWRATVHRVAKSWTRLKWLSRYVHVYFNIYFLYNFFPLGSLS